MNRFYQPSGKISAWVFPYFLVCASGIVPMLAFGYTFLIHFFYSTKGTVFFFLMAVIAMESICQYFVVKKGKVRNRKTAAFTAFLLSAFFVLFSGASGFVAYGVRDELWFSALQFLTVLVFLEAGFLMEASKPFCEVSKTWAKEITILFELPEDTDALVRKLLTCDDSLFDGLKRISADHAQADRRRLQNIAGGHLLFRLWVTEGESDYYLTVVKKRAKQGRGGRIHYSDEELTRWLVVKREIGRRLLTWSQMQEEQPVLPRVSVRKGLFGKRVKSVIQALVSLGLMAVMFLLLNCRIAVQMPAAVMISYGITVCLLSSMSLIGCFIKETVIELDALEPGEAGWEHGAEMVTADSGIAVKLYYLVLVAGSVFYLVLVVRMHYI